MILRYIFKKLGHQQWLRFGIRYRIILRFHNPDKCKSETFQIPFYGRSYIGDFSSYIDWSAYYFGAYCMEELMIMRDAMNGVTEPVILDIGANVGHHSLFASTIACQVHSFEPFHIVFNKLKEKIEFNKIKNITLHEIGLGEINEEIPFTPPTNCNLGTGSFTNTNGAPSTLILPIRNGDEYLIPLTLEKIDFIKMDIEGFEPQALNGLKETLKAYRPVIFFEWSANHRDIHCNEADLFPELYRIFNFVEDVNVFGIFRKSGYRLIENGGLSIDGNKVALPIEKTIFFINKII